MNSFFSPNELISLGFNKIGENVLISRKASIYEPHLIEIGDNVRIDDFCILSGSICLGSFIHISAYTALYGKYGIILDDFTTISGRVTIYSQNDDYSGAYMTNPMIPKQFTNVTGGPVQIKKHSIIGAGSIVLPNLTINEGVAVGAMSLINRSLKEWRIYAGIPAKYLKPRSKALLQNEKFIR
jgi:galactoside O-acetyltransferase